jgi:hydroxymethylglutaryl-CoA lyase
MSELIPAGTRIHIHEVGPREGFQIEERMVPVDEKVEFIDALSATGIEFLQVTSYVHPRAIPQHADAEEVMSRIQRPDGVMLGVVVPNIRGAERALASGAEAWALMLSVTDSHSRANANCTTEEALLRLPDVVAAGKENGIRMDGGMSMALGCVFEGEVPYSRVARVVEGYLDLGIDHISVADTAGVADPNLVFDTMTALHQDYPGVEFKLHLHDTRGMGLANAMAGMMAGVRTFDSSVGGVGGCPYAPGAKGNIATEDLVHMLDLMGVETGIDLDALIEVARTLPSMFGHPVPGSVLQAGTSRQLSEISAARLADSRAL